MVQILIPDIIFSHDIDELARVFLKPSDFVLLERGQTADKNAIIIEAPSGVLDKDGLKRHYYDELHRLTGYKPPWGILTGVRPTKKCNEYLSEGLTGQEIRKLLTNDFYVNEDKAGLVLETCHNQSGINSDNVSGSVGIYIGIPFCPTRCVYCSFTSNVADDKKIEGYIAALFKEIDAIGFWLKKNGLCPESIYLGGGTPTTLSESVFERLLQKITSAYDFRHVREFTIEAGRPDTITLGKLDSIIRHHGTRISINPQSMNQKTLDAIGRSHTPAQIKEAFLMAKSVGIPIINADIIAGLPGESDLDFAHTVQEVLALSPQNITVHTLAMKRASRLAEINRDYNYEIHMSLDSMLKSSREMLTNQGYVPYYLYRQKQTTGNFENVGYAYPGTQGIYNIRIMEEHQTIIALGAGGISKICFPEENRHERVPNVSDLDHYIERIDEMIKRKTDLMIGPAIKG